MSDTFFHLLGPGTQPGDDSFSMNPLPLTCQVNSSPSMARLENCPHSPAVMALLADVRHQLSQKIPVKQDVRMGFIHAQRRRPHVFEYAARRRRSFRAYPAG